MAEYEQHIKQQNRDRAKRFYEGNKDVILQKRKDRRLKVNDIIKKFNDMTVNKPTQPAPVQPPIIGKEIIMIKRKPTPTTQKLTLEYCKNQMNGMTATGSTVPLEQSTIEKLKKNIKQFFTLIKNDDIRPLLENPQTIIDTIEKTPYKLATRLDVLVSVLKLIHNKIIPDYPHTKYELLDKYYQKVKKESTEERNQKATDPKHAVDKIETLKKLIIDKYGVVSKENIILNLFIEAPKRDDYYLKIVPTEKETDDKHNYIIVPNKGNIKILINKHKTDKKYQAELEPLSPALTKTIKEYIDKNKITDYLFSEKKIGPFIKKMFMNVKKDINGVSALRHIIVANAFSNKDITLDQSSRLGDIMKHKPATQAQYKRLVK
jgi:hypothetical protein